MYVCHGQCSGPQCDFTHTMRQCQSLVWLDNRGGNEIESSPIFQSEVVAMTDSSLRKLDEKKQTLSHMRELLADKLESKQQRRRNKSESRKNSNFSEEQVQGLEFPFPLGTICHSQMYSRFALFLFAFVPPLFCAKCEFVLLINIYSTYLQRKQKLHFCQLPVFYLFVRLFLFDRWVVILLYK
jgi:hypothetical protein